MSKLIFVKRRLYGLLSNRDIDIKLNQLNYRKLGYQNYKKRYNSYKDDIIDIEEWIKIVEKKILRYEKMLLHKNKLKDYLMKNDKKWK